MLNPLQPARPLGKTGVDVPLIGYGTAPLGKEAVSFAHSARCLNLAIDLGITYLDTSPDYGSEPHVGAVLRQRRDEVFLATKVNRRSKAEAVKELKGSLGRLQTDHVDLIQVHAVNTLADLQQALAPDGVIAGLEEARRQGMCRFIGITGHARPDILAAAIERYPFDTVLCALGIADHLVSAADEMLLPMARSREIGVIAMKALGHGQYQNVDLALRYSLGLPGVSLAIVGMDVEVQIEQVVEIAAHCRPLSEPEEARLIEEARALILKDAKMDPKEQGGEQSLFWLHDTTVMGWQEADEPALVRY